MGVFDRLFTRAAAPSQPVYLTAGYPLLPYGVTPESVLGLSAVWRCLQILSDSVALLPWQEWQGTMPVPNSPLVTRPYEPITRRQWTAEVVISLALYNVAYLWAVDGQLVPVPNRLILPGTTASTLVPPTSYMIGSQEVPATDIRVLRRMPFPGLAASASSPVNIARSLFSAMLASDSYVARYWAAGGSPVTLLKADQPLTQPQAEAVRTSWQNARSMGPDYPAVLDAGLDASPFGADPTAETATLARRDMIADVARLFGVPIRMLESAVAGASNTYINAELSGLELVRGTLSGYVQIIEDAITDELNGTQMLMNTDPLTKPVQLTRFESYQIALQNGFMTVDEVRAEEGLPPLEPSAASLAPTLNEVPV